MTASAYSPDRLKYKKSWQALAWVMVAIIVWLSLTPSPPQPPLFLAWDKAQHCVAYGVLMYWFGMCFPRHWRWPVFLVGLGIAMEILQGLGGARSFDLFDMIANAIGVGMGLLLMETHAGLCLVEVDKRLTSRAESSV